jgi:hypothetical protein
LIRRPSRKAAEPTSGSPRPATGGPVRARQKR